MNTELDESMKKAMTTPSHFRYVDAMHNSEKITVHCVKFFTVRETPCYSFIVDEHTADLAVRTNGSVMSSPFFKRSIRKVRKNAVRSYAHDDKEKALRSFIHRKEKQLWYANLNKCKAESILNQIEQIKNGAEEVTSGRFIVESVEVYS